MSPGEILWRGRAVARDRLDRWRLPAQQLRAARLAGDGAALIAPGFHVCRLPLAAWSNIADAGEFAEAASELRRRADAILHHRIRLFDIDDCDLGEVIDWNRDYKHGVQSPMGYAPDIDYRDFRLAGDCKFVWEPNRHQHFVVMARAYRAFGESKYADEILSQWSGWLAQCPFGHGMNWRSPLELAIRLINWIWALDLLRPVGTLPEELRRKLLAAIWLHVWEVARKFSKGSSANNHVIGEAAGVYIACRYLPAIPNFKAWGDRARDILCREIVRQTYECGCTREHAFGYHLFVLQFFTLANAVAREVGETMPPKFEQRLRGMHEFAARLLDGGDIPMVGDADDGYVLDLDRDPLNPRAWLGIGARLFPSASLGGGADDGTSAHLWMPGGLEDSSVRDRSREGKRDFASYAMSDAGYYVLQTGEADAIDRMSVLFDCGELGFGALAAHGHADALSFTLRVGGRDILVDPGAYDYFSHPQWRAYFRGTQAHNTVLIDDSQQSETLGLFLWGRRASTRCCEWHSDACGARVVGEHDGYTRLTSPVIHRRTLELQYANRTLTVRDEFNAPGRRRYALHLHFAEDCRVRPLGDACFAINATAQSLMLEMDPLLRTQVVRGSEDPIAGWISRGYHRRTPTATLIGRIEHEGPLVLSTRIRLVLADEPKGIADRQDPGFCSQESNQAGVELHEERV